MTGPSRSGAVLEDTLLGARFLRRLPGFLRHPVTPEAARAVLRQRLERREADFLTLVRRAIYENPPSPYLKLLRVVGCEQGDVEALVRQEGIEGALHTLFRAGVYLTIDELKGRRPVVRGTTTLAVEPSRLNNPVAGREFPVKSGGSRGAGTQMPMALEFIRDRAVDVCLVLHARRGLNWPKATWAVPGGTAMIIILELSGAGMEPLAWFSQLDPAESRLHPRYRWSARVMRWGGLLAGRMLPSPVHVPLSDPLPIVRWMEHALKQGRSPYVHTFASCGVRLCAAAEAAGVSLRGAQFTLSGEPLTASRLDMIHRAGAEARPYYAIIECGPMGYGCLKPQFPDEVHFPADLHAVIQPGPGRGEARGLPRHALLVSSLRLTAPMILLNVSFGDQAHMLRRSCDCPLEQLGWTTHLHSIRSFEKLTAGGMAFLDGDAERVLEEVLPARFGGQPTDYQLVEEEADDGQPRLRLLVAPALGPLDLQEVAATFLTAIGHGSGAERVTRLVWRDGDVFRVERMRPHSTAAGKILHLHVQGRSGSRDGE